jgi:hypothetical protein
MLIRQSFHSEPDITKAATYPQHSSKVVTYFADMQRSLGRYSSLADSGAEFSFFY